VLYTADLVPLAAEDRLHSHFYADDTMVCGWTLVFSTASYLGKDQLKGRGTRDAIVALHVLYERNLEYSNHF